MSTEIEVDIETEGGAIPNSASSLVLQNEADSYNNFFHSLPRVEDVNRYYDSLLLKAKVAGPEILKKIRRKLCREDRFYLLTRELHREDANRQWVYEHCRMVERDTDEYMDLWPRDYYKSTVITFAGTIQEIIKNPEVTICIYSYKRPIAKKFLKQIMTELNTNKELVALFPEIFWERPKSQAPSWSLDGGICVNRKSRNPNQTVEAWGLIDSQPTSAHFMLRIYDDIVTRDTVETDGMIEKGRLAYMDSQNTGTTEGGRQWLVGTIWHYSETYHWIAGQGRIKPRLFSCTEEGTWPGTPVFRTYEELEKKYVDMGPRVFGAQMLMDISQLSNKSFQADWLQYYHRIDFTGMNIYILGDPAKKKEKKHDFTAFVIIGLAGDGNFYVLDWVRDKLGLAERFSMLQALHSKFKPNGIYYEEYGVQSDIEYFTEKMQQVGYHFYLAPLGGTVPKESRIDRMVPDLAAHRWWFPQNCFKTNYEGKRIDVTNEFVTSEYLAYPFGEHDDLLDVCSRIYDIPERTFPAFSPNMSMVQFAAEALEDDDKWDPLYEESSYDIFAR